MTAAELIARLAELPPDMIVLTGAGDWGHSRCEGVERGYFNPYDDTHGWHTEHPQWNDPDDDPQHANIPAVVLV